ncbi:MAG: sigma-70 family RNA polymerase sigma factor [Acidobacteriota bacterium]|nr:sigma-70 family RNA polymerase sigma factor [Acidobacteriota bacterium]
MSVVIPKPVDAGVLLRAQQGDRRALEIFFGHHLPLLRSWVASRVPRWLEPQADKDDLVQLAAIKTLRRLHHLSPDRLDTIQPYMRQTVLNLIRDEARRAGRTPSHVPIEDEHHASRDVSALDELAGRAAWNAYRAAKKQLSARDRKAVVGRVERGLSYESLQEVLGVESRNTARVVVTRAIERLVRRMCAAPGALPDRVCRPRKEANRRGRVARRPPRRAAGRK